MLLGQSVPLNLAIVMICSAVHLKWSADVKEIRTNLKEIGVI
jgi:hypothetical protein